MLGTHARCVAAAAGTPPAITRVVVPSFHPPAPCTPPSSGPCSNAPPVTELFAPAYSLALAPDPLLAAGSTAGPGPAPQQAQQQRQQQQDVFLAVGLDSGISDFKRPRLNLAILLDVSGSMDGGQTC